MRDFVAGDQRVEGRRVDDPPESVLHPRQVVHGVAEVGEFPVDEPSEVTLVGHEVAGAGVTLDQHRAPDRFGNMGAQRCQRVHDLRIGRSADVGGEAGPQVELGERVIRCLTGPGEAVERQRVDVDRVQLGEGIDELEEHGLAFVVGESREVGGPRDPFDQQGLAVVRRRKEARNAHGGLTQRAVHHALPASDSTEPENAPSPLSSRTTKAQWLAGTLGIDEPRRT